MKQIRVSDTVSVPAGLRVLPEAPNNGEYITLYKTQSGFWCAQFWMRVNEQSIADYTEERASKSQALQDAFELAATEGVPFIDTIVREQDAIRVESTVESGAPDALHVESEVVDG